MTQRTGAMSEHVIKMIERTAHLEIYVRVHLSYNKASRFVLAKITKKEAVLMLRHSYTSVPIDLDKFQEGWIVLGH